MGFGSRALCYIYIYIFFLNIFFSIWASFVRMCVCSVWQVSQHLSAFWKLWRQWDPDGMPRVPLNSGFYIRWAPHPIVVTIRDNKDYIRVLLYSYYITITGWGVLLKFYR